MVPFKNEINLSINQIKEFIEKLSLKEYVWLIIIIQKSLSWVLSSYKIDPIQNTLVV